MSEPFNKLWPGNRLWVMFDVCSEKEEMSDLSEGEKKHFKLLSDRMAHNSCDFGLPCVSILKHALPFDVASNLGVAPFDLAANSAMAPFGPISTETFDEVAESFDMAANSGISCGWYCLAEQVNCTDHVVLWDLLKRKPYRFLVYGPEKTGLINDLIKKMTQNGNEVWVITDGLRRQVLNGLSPEIKHIDFSEIETTYQKNGGYNPPDIL